MLPYRNFHHIFTRYFSFFLLSFFFSSTATSLVLERRSLFERMRIQFERTDLVRRYYIYIEARVKGAALKPKVERRSLAEGETTRRVLPESTEESLFRYVEHVSSSRLPLFNLPAPFEPSFANKR